MLEAALHTADWHLGRRFPSFPDEGTEKVVAGTYGM